MPAAKLRPVLPEHHDHAARHVLAAVIANAFDNRDGAGIAHREPFSGHAVEERFAAGGAVQAHVADQNIFLRHKMRIARRINHHSPAGKPLAHVVVGFAFQRQRHALGQERAEALSRAAVKLDANRVVRQSQRSRAGARCAR